MRRMGGARSDIPSIAVRDVIGLKPLRNPLSIYRVAVMGIAALHPSYGMQ